MVVLDPPAFTKAHANMASACRGYKEIALSAMRLLPAGGVLATHSCSYHMPEEVFVNTVLSAAQDLHRQVRVITRVVRTSIIRFWLDIRKAIISRACGCKCWIDSE